MSGGYFNYEDSNLKYEIFGFGNTCTNVFEDKEISQLIYDVFDETKSHGKKVKLFSRMLAVSIFSGLQECFRCLEVYEFSNQDVGQLIRLYFRLYFL